MKKIFDGEMLIMTLPTTLLENICKIIFNSKVIYKSITDPDDNLLEELFSINGLSSIVRYIMRNNVPMDR